VKSAAATVAAVTADQVLHVAGRLQPGESVVVHAAAGGVGTLMVQMAKLAGARVIATASTEEKRQLALSLGADVAVEAVGVPPTFELAAALARPGGHIANIGVHGQPVTLHLEELWIRNVTITTGLVDTYSTPTLLRLAQGHQVDAGRFITHHFTLDQFDEAYDVFARAADTGALKVVLSRN
jgi:alcohol dehydrogenase